MKVWQWMILGLVFALPSFGVTKVGNGDDGRDLEGAVPVEDGILVESRDKALQLLNRLNVSAIAGLGMLVPELKTSPMYFTQLDTQATLPNDSHELHINLSGFVYARTFCEPHAPTRFFPAALKLSSDQLVALHIHEALHRALPEGIREDEVAVARLTLAISSPDATYDRVALTAKDLGIDKPKEFANGEDHFSEPSSVGYSFRQFWAKPGLMSYPIERMHLIQSEWYPFGGRNAPIGFGIENAFVTHSKGTQLGPLGLMAKIRLWSFREFDIGIFGQSSWNVLSAEELKNSPFGRDIFTLGSSFRKELSHFYVENLISYTFRGQSSRQLGRVKYLYDYGPIVNAKIRLGIRWKTITFGGFLDLHLADYFRVRGGAFQNDSGRYRIFSMGPEFNFVTGRYALGVGGRFLIDATQGANFDYLGNLMGPGISQGGMYASAKVHF